jgi:hypothetical protein
MKTRQVHPRRGNGPLVQRGPSPCRPHMVLFLTSIMPRSLSAEEEQEAKKPQERHSRDDRKSHHHARRSRSPRRDEDRHRHKRHRPRSPTAKPVVLPYKAKPLSKRQFEDYKPLFQSYLDIQKQIQLDDLDEREAKGRWKSFISRWYAHPHTKPCTFLLEVKC